MILHKVVVIKWIDTPQEIQELLAPDKFVDYGVRNGFYLEWRIKEKAEDLDDLLEQLLTILEEN